MVPGCIVTVTAHYQQLNESVTAADAEVNCAKVTFDLGYWFDRNTTSLDLALEQLLDNVNSPIMSLGPAVVVSNPRLRLPASAPPRFVSLLRPFLRFRTLTRKRGALSITT